MRQEVGPVNPTKPGKEIESCQIKVSDQNDRSQTCMIGTLSFSNCVVSLLHQFPIIFTTVKPLDSLLDGDALFFFLKGQASKLLHQHPG